MVYKTISRLLILILTLLPLSVLYSQNSSFVMETTTRFIQRLTWTAAENVLRYEVVVQEETGGTYRQAWQGFTTNTFIEVSLPPGNYRFRVIPYNLFNLPGQASVWMSFVIYPALNPEIESFTPQSFIIQQDQTEYELNITGKNISQGASIFLRRPGTTRTINPEQTTITPDGNTATLLFLRDQLEQGIFLLHVINTSGLEKSIGDFVIEVPVIQQRAPVIEIPPVTEIPPAEIIEAIEIPTDAVTETLTEVSPSNSLDILLGLSWTPLFEIPRFDQQHFDGAALRFGLVSSNSNLFNIGFELSVAYYIFGSLLLENNFLLQTRLINQKLFLFFRIGAGLILPIGDPTVPTQLDTRTVYVNTGLSLCYTIFRNFYIEAGINYSYKFGVENHFSLLKPMIGLGVRL